MKVFNTLWKLFQNKHRTQLVLCLFSYMIWSAVLIISTIFENELIFRNNLILDKALENFDEKNKKTKHKKI